jgi:CubicO group peptidase (beta-lactamase class C family)
MKTVTPALLLFMLLAAAGCEKSSGDVGRPSQTPETNIHLAALQGDVEAVRRHIAAGSDLNEKDAYGSTPLIVAATFGRAEVAGALIEAGADLAIGNDDGSTALHIAAFLCRTEIVASLLAKGAETYLRNNAGSTAFDSVRAPFADVKGLYDSLGQALAPLGLEMDYTQIKTTRPRIAEMLRPRAADLEAVEYKPLPGDGWTVSTPAEQGLDPLLVAELYSDASRMETLYGLLVVKNGRLIAEGYFNGGGIEQLSGRQSVTKSYVSALAGIALDQGYLSSPDQKMMDFFPELAGLTTDPRKEQITIRDLLRMRAGYPDEQRTSPYFDRLFLSGDRHWIPHLIDFPLVSDPGTEFNYSNLTSHLLGVIVARACHTDLASYGQENLFSPLDTKVGRWTADADSYNLGCTEIYVTARDMARFGLLYLWGGEYAGKRILSADWVRESLQTYSQGMYANQWRPGVDNYPGPYLRDIGYGYQWWSARVGGRRFSFAWGHGGNLIILLHDLDMIVVTTADPLHELPGEKAWKYEGGIINLVGKFILYLPEA